MMELFCLKTPVSSRLSLGSLDKTVPRRSMLGGDRRPFGEFRKVYECKFDY